MKKLISVVIVIIMVAGLFPTMVSANRNVNGSAAYSTESVATYLKGLIGTSAKEWGGASGTQCVELPKYYIEKFYGTKSTYNMALGDGNSMYYYVPNAFPNLFTQINYYDGFVPQPGDIISYHSETSPQYGHAAIVYDVNGSNYSIIEQWAGSGTVRSRTVSIKAGQYGVSYSIIGAARPTQVSPLDPKMWCENINLPDQLACGQSFSLSGNICGNNCVKWYAIVIYDSNNKDIQNKDEAVWEITTTNSYPITTVADKLDFSVLPVGNYRLSIQSMDKDNNYFGAYSKEFSVLAPDKPSNVTINTPVAHYSVGDTVMFNITADNAVFYSMRIKKSGEDYYVLRDQTASTQSVTINDEGLYTAYIGAWNTAGWTESSIIDFSVGENYITSVTFGTSEYELYQQYGTWEEAEAICEAKGGHLVTITSAEENAALKPLLDAASTNLWIGATDKNSEGTWKWVTGETFWDNGTALMYCNWNTNEPSNTSDEDYGTIYTCVRPDAYAKWNDRAIRGALGFILEKDRETEIINYVAATCIKTGYSGDIVIKGTNEVIEYGKTMPALGHNYIAGTSVSPTCTEQGYTTHTCSRCGNSYNDDLIPALRHNYTSVVTAPTCTEKGFTMYTCTRCGDSFVSDMVPAKGHSFKDGYCTVCGAADPNYNPDPNAPKYTVAGATGIAGKTVDVYVSIENNPGIISLRNSISYDTSALELVKVENLGILNGYTTPSANITSPYTLRWADSLATTNNVSNGELVKLTFLVKDTTAVGDYEISVNSVEARDVNGTKVTFSAAKATISVIDYIIGDVDGDLEVTDWDAILLNRYLAGWDVEINLYAADVDVDGEVSDWDAIVLERYLAGWDVTLG